MRLVRESKRRRRGCVDGSADTHKGKSEREEATQ